MFVAALGWLGALGTFVAYVLVSRGWLSATSRRYAVLNILGGVLGGTASAIYGAWPSVASNFVWAVVGLATVGAGVRNRWGRAVSLARRSPPESADCPTVHR